MKYFWVRHKETGAVTIAHYKGGGLWRFFDKIEDQVGLVLHEIIEEILMLEERPQPECPPKAVKGTLTMSKQLNVGDTSTATVSFQDKEGANVSLPEGNKPSWSVDQVALLGMVVADDGMSAALTAQAVGAATLTVVAEGDPTPGVDTITVTATVEIVDEASTGKIDFS